MHYYLAERGVDHVFVVCKQSNFTNVSFLYKDHDNITPIPIPCANEKLEVSNLRKSLDIPLVTTHIPFGRCETDRYWDLAFYETLGLDYSIKHQYAALPTVDCSSIIMEHIGPKQDYAFVYDDSSRGYSFEPRTNMRVVKNISTLNIFEMQPIIANAAELHVMSGGLMCVMELMGVPLSGQNCFYYPIRGDLNFYNKEKFRRIN